MTRKHHIHRYEKQILGKKGYTVFRCNLPDCTHYVAEKLALGKRTVCNRCGEEMILDKRASKLVKPHCVDCIQGKKAISHDKLLEFVQAHDSVGDKLDRIKAMLESPMDNKERE